MKGTWQSLTVAWMLGLVAIVAIVSFGWAMIRTQAPNPETVRIEFVTPTSDAPSIVIFVHPGEEKLVMDFSDDQVLTVAPIGAPCNDLRFGHWKVVNKTSVYFVAGQKLATCNSNQMEVRTDKGFKFVNVSIVVQR